MNGEFYSYLIGVLFSAGAKDVTYTSVYMKKNLPGIQVSVLVDAPQIKAIEEILLLETTTFGLRKFPVERTVLDRILKRVETPFGQVKIKIGRYKNKIVKVTPEYEVLKKIAKTLNLPLPQVYNDVNAWLLKEMKDNRL